MIMYFPRTCHLLQQQHQLFLIKENDRKVLVTRSIDLVQTRENNFLSHAKIDIFYGTIT